MIKNGKLFGLIGGSEAVVLVAVVIGLLFYAGVFKIG